MAQRNFCAPFFVIDDQSKIIVFHELFDNDEYEHSPIFLRRIFRELVSEMFRIYNDKEGYEEDEDIDEDEFYVEFLEQLHFYTDKVISSMSKSDKNLVISEYGVDYAYEKLEEINPDISISDQFVLVCLSGDIVDLDKLVRDTVQVMLYDRKYYNYRVMFEN